MLALTSICQRHKLDLKTWAGFAKHEAALRGAKDTLDDISHEKPHSEFLRQLMMDAKVANQLGTLGGGMFLFVKKVNLLCQIQN